LSAASHAASMETAAPSRHRASGLHPQRLTLTAHQPVYLPWLGLFHKIMLADLFCVFDIVQYQRKDFNNRNKIKTQSGPIWLSVPVESRNHLNTRICDLKIVQDDWARRHARSIRHSYQKAPFFRDYIDRIEGFLLGRRYGYLTDLNTDMLTMFMAALDITVPLVKASDCDFVGKKSDLVLDMCVKLAATDYIFGAQGRNYADTDSFRDRRIKAYFQAYVHPAYPQLGGAFTSHMSIIDLLFNVGRASRDVIMAGNAGSLDLLETEGAPLGRGGVVT
jgi:WbqC-like protein family